MQGASRPLLMASAAVTAAAVQQQAERDLQAQQVNQGHLQAMP